MTAQRRYLSDVVFEHLGAMILRGEIPPGSPLPPEQALSDELSVSKILVRQGIHRLAEADLVSVRQGEKTRAKDPARAASLALIALYYRLAPELPLADALVRAVLEKQYAQGLSLTEMFARRGTRAQKKELARLVSRHQRTASTESGLAALERAFFGFIADASENPIFAAEVRYWYETLAERPRMPNPAPPSLRFAFYEELARRFVRERDALGYYVTALSPLMRALHSPEKTRLEPRAEKKRAHGKEKAS